MKLVLFDIDGTLVLTGGAGMRAMDRAFHRLFGAARALQGVTLAGRTDRVIVSEALERLAPGVRLDDEWLASFREIYCGYLEEEIADGVASGKRILPGVRPLLDALSTRDDVALGLLTGNFSRSARIKLDHFGLWHYFAWGAFGDDHVDRNELLPVALAAAREARGLDVPPGRVFVIGDTPNDVACARSGGAQAIAVATGPSSVDDLWASGADVVFGDLSDTNTVIGVIA
jgi:phosphoglycolate phosphatase-like HAD superfamily hydrolase